MRRVITAAIILVAAAILLIVVVSDGNETTSRDQSELSASPARENATAATPKAGRAPRPPGANGLVDAVSRAEQDARRVTEDYTVKSPGEIAAQPPSDADQDILEQMNDYFALQVWPRVRPCFADLPEGSVQFAHHFVNDGKGTFDVVPGDGAVALHDSTLDEQHDDYALDCMRQAVAGTSFPIPEQFKGEPTGVLYWTWPTPVVEPYETISVKSP